MRIKIAKLVGIMTAIIHVFDEDEAVIWTVLFVAVLLGLVTGIVPLIKGSH